VLEKVQENYLKFARAEPLRFVIVDALKDKDEIAQFVADAIRQLVKTGKGRRKQQKKQ
jgi:dTMP kinase